MLKLPHRDPLPINELARVLDKHVATIFRWGSRRGVRGHRLTLTRIGGRTYVYQADWNAFLQRLNGGAMQDPQGQAQQDKRVDAELDAAGI